MNTEKRVKVTSVSVMSIRTEEVAPSRHILTLTGQADHKYLPRVGDFCIIEETPKGWRILRRTFAP